jgi:hypothetical protein
VTFETVWDGPIIHQPEEVAWGAFVLVGELRRRLHTWEFVPDGLQALRYFLDREAGAGPDGARSGLTPG